MDGNQSTNQIYYEILNKYMNSKYSYSTVLATYSTSHHILHTVEQIWNWESTIFDQFCYRYNTKLCHTVWYCTVVLYWGRYCNSYNYNNFLTYGWVYENVGPAGFCNTLRHYSTISSGISNEVCTYSLIWLNIWVE